MVSEKTVADIYRAPQSDLAREESEDPEFYVVSPKKFLILFLSTAGFYRIYWFYVNWRYRRQKSGEDLWPVPRAIFAIFFTHSLFRLFDERLRERGSSYAWSHASVATGFVVASIAESLLERISAREVGEPFLDIIGLLVLVPLAWSLYVAQKAANIACGDPEGLANDRLTPANFIWIALGALFWLLIFIGLLDMTVGLPALE